jgi:type IV pilus assembly protein PilE
MMLSYQRKGVRLPGSMRGVTLLELMIVVVIIGVLAAIAYPSYRDVAARAKRVEAKAALLQIATNQERFYLQNNSYTADMTQLGFNADPFISDSGSYTISVTAADPTGYTAVATYLLGGKEDDRCGVFQIDGSGNKTFTGTAENCWSASR